MVRDSISRIYWPLHLSVVSPIDPHQTLVPSTIHHLLAKRHRQLSTHPTSPHPCPSGFLIGWNVRDLVCCVACVVPACDVALPQLEHALAVLANDASLQHLFEQCGGAPTILGYWTALDASSKPLQVEDEAVRVDDEEEEEDGEEEDDDGAEDEVMLRHRVQTSDIWIALEESPSTYLPVLQELYVCGYRERALSQVVLYRRPARSSFLSTQPASLDRFGNPRRAVGMGRTVVERALEQINTSSQLEKLLSDALRLVTILPDVPRVAGVDEHALELRLPTPPLSSLAKHESRVWWDDFVRPILVLLVHLVLLSVRVLLGVLMGALAHVDLLARHSTLLRQADTRIRQLCRLPLVWLRTKRKWSNDAFGHASFVALWNMVWRLIVDVAGGVMIGIALRMYASETLGLLHQASQILHADVLRNQVHWLMGMPAGMKLNLPLNVCLGSLILHGIDMWDSLTAFVVPLEGVLLEHVSVVGVFGASMLLATMSDLLFLFTLHIDLLHTAFSRLHAAMLSVLYSLFNLFRGKKRNVLRQRVDNCEYDMDQLLVGTMFFTLIVFLFPTIFIYYMFFSLVRLVVTMVQATLWMLLSFFNYFPFFSIVVYFLDQGRLPSGISFQLLSVRSNPSDTTYLILNSSVLSLPALFHHYKHVLQEILRHYTPARVLTTLARGRSFPIWRAPLLPSLTRSAHIPSTFDFWLFLKAYLS